MPANRPRHALRLLCCTLAPSSPCILASIRICSALSFCPYLCKHLHGAAPAGRPYCPVSSRPLHLHPSFLVFSLSPSLGSCVSRTRAAVHTTCYSRITHQSSRAHRRTRTRIIPSTLAFAAVTSTACMYLTYRIVRYCIALALVHRPPARPPARRRIQKEALPASLHFFTLFAFFFFFFTLGDRISSACTLVMAAADARAWAPYARPRAVR